MLACLETEMIQMRWWASGSTIENHRCSNPGQRWRRCFPGGWICCCVSSMKNPFCMTMSSASLMGSMNDFRWTNKLWNYWKQWKLIESYRLPLSIATRASNRSALSRLILSHMLLHNFLYQTHHTFGYLWVHRMCPVSVWTMDYGLCTPSVLSYFSPSKSKTK